MARKRITRKPTDSPPRASKRSQDNGSDSLARSMTSSIRIILLLLVGVGICAFLFYPDILKVVNALNKDNSDSSIDDMENTAKANRHSNIPDSEQRHVRNDAMETEEIDDDDDMRDQFPNLGGDEDEEIDPETFEIMEDESDIPVQSELHRSELNEEVEEKTDKTQTKHEQPSKTSQADDKKPSKDTHQDEPKQKKQRGEYTPSKSEEGMVFKFSDDDDTAKTMDIRMDEIKHSDEPKKSVEPERPKEDDADSEANKHLPKEVREYKPRYLRSVTAKKIFADGRRIPPIELLPQKPTNSSVRVFLFNDFLSTEECDGLRNAHDKHVAESNKQDPILCFDGIQTLRQHLKEVKKKIKVTPNIFTKGTKCVNATFSRQLADWLHRNWSYSTAFYPGESRFSAVFANRVKAAMGLDQENGGKFQLTSYPKGKAYKSHTDCVVDGSDKRDRVATVLVYLDDVKEGGETKFPELGIWVKPRKGRALVWNNMDEDGGCEADSLHTASKVEEGNKYVLIRWYYYKSFFSLGKRPPEPPLPDRSEGQPRVSCDEFEHGSCRWYDEWNFEHMLEYERQKLTLI